MRIFSPLSRVRSLKAASFFLNRSFASRMLLLGLPLLASVLLLIFFFTGRSIETIVNRAIARNAQLQAQAISLALEQILVETRNQLLILAAGSMDRQDMLRRLKFRAQAEGLRYREVAFMGVGLENRFLLLNYGGEIIAIPPQAALDTPASPFHTLSAGQRPGHVNVSPPLEVVYPMVPVNGSLQSLPLYVIRFSTPIYDSEGEFQGILVLSLDLEVLRDAVSLFSSPEAPINAGGEGTRIRSLFFDKDGWMLFQSETPGKSRKENVLSSDAVRAGFRGDFGRPGFNSAFRPGPEHLNYWNMVADVQNGHAGQLFLANEATAWSDGPLRVEGVSYAPVTFMPNAEGPRAVLGGLAVLDTSFTATRTGLQIVGTYALCFAGGLLLLGLGLWWLARGMGTQLNILNAELQSRNENDDAEALSLPRLPLELEKIKGNINALLERLRRANAEQISQEAVQTAQWRREPVEGLPSPSALPEKGLVGTSAPMQALYSQIQKAAQVLADVLIVGETGTGKELVSQAIHRLSRRADGPFITINCGALDETLLMDTLFGHVKGAFTEAKQARKGAFLAAEGGTLMLDEIGNATPKVQQALLRALSTRSIRPLGSDHDLSFDTRIIAATNAELHGDARDGSFREDLYYRLAVLTIRTPPLRRRKEDIPALVVYFLARAVQASDPERARSLPRISRGALDKLMRHHWPGNVRELENTLTRALTFCEGQMLYAENIQFGPGSPPPPPHPAAKEQGVDSDNETTAPEKSASADTARAAGATTDISVLNYRQRGLLPRLRELGSISRQEYQALAAEGISMRTAQYDLQLLVRLGLMRKEGRGPAQRYVFTAHPLAGENGQPEKGACS